MVNHQLNVDSLILRNTCDREFGELITWSTHYLYKYHCIRTGDQVS